MLPYVVEPWTPDVSMCIACMQTSSNSDRVCMQAVHVKYFWVLTPPITIKSCWIYKDFRMRTKKIYTNKQLHSIRKLHMYNKYSKYSQKFRQKVAVYTVCDFLKYPMEPKVDNFILSMAIIPLSNAIATMTTIKFEPCTSYCFVEEIAHYAFNFCQLLS